MVALASTFHPVLGMFFYYMGPTFFNVSVVSAAGHVLPDTSPNLGSRSSFLLAFLLAFWLSGFLACLTSGSLAFWLPGFLAFWLSGLLVFWLSGLLARLASGPCWPCFGVRLFCLRHSLVNFSVHICVHTSFCFTPWGERLFRC